MSPLTDKEKELWMLLTPQIRYETCSEAMTSAIRKAVDKHVKEQETTETKESSSQKDD